MKSGVVIIINCPKRGIQFSGRYKQRDGRFYIGKSSGSLNLLGNVGG